MSGFLPEEYAIKLLYKRKMKFHREIKSSFYELREVTIGLLPPEAIKEVLNISAVNSSQFSRRFIVQIVNINFKGMEKSVIFFILFALGSLYVLNIVYRKYRGSF